MSLERWIAVFFLVFSLVYGFAAWNYPLLPFEQNMVFLPNTLPMGLSLFGVLFSLILIFTTARSSEEDDDVLGGIDVAELRQYKFGQALAILAAMVIYALALRPVGFIGATTLFLVGGGMILGERKFHVLIPTAFIGTFVIWYLVQELLGVFLRPWPFFVQ